MENVNFLKEYFINIQVKPSKGEIELLLKLGGGQVLSSRPRKKSNNVNFYFFYFLKIIFIVADKESK